ncbi:MAG: 16S rRNA (cytosine967-C5)-methyltransferase [Rhodobacteraceae bacterium HLUCCO18]|nr:MAG: 16S rRNA (cytosine967-C5)-methyltransferase [Rhodobacteraceae bacterium HLUCCO18]
MTPGARVAAAISVLDAWRGGMAVEQALTRWARGARYAGSKDRAAVRDHVYDALRRLRSVEFLGGGTDGRALLLGLVRLSALDPDALFTGEGHAPAALSEGERALVAAPPLAPDPEADIPDWLRAPLAERAATPEALFAALCARAPVWLRVNMRRGTVEAARDELSRDGVETVSCEATPGALRVTDGARRLRAARAYAEGRVEVQDLSAQRAVSFVDWPRTGCILDYCAGGGGKALAIADRTDAALCAHDALPRRMVDLPARADRAGVSITLLDTARAVDHGPFDAVLCDVPCSGTGTWRRDPEAKWRLTPDRLEELRQLQAEILDATSPLVAPGGRLVYMTCSLLRAENEDQVGAFMARAPGWSLIGTQLDTPLTASDGFFTAVLARDAVGS